MVRACLVALCCIAAGMLASGCGGLADDADASGVPVLGFVSARDQSTLYQEMFQDCEQQSGGAFRIEAITVPTSVDAQREQLARRLSAGDSSIDIINMDVIWTAELADAGWITDLTDQITPMTDRWVPAALQSLHYRGKYWGIPVGTNAALMYYRTDLVKTPPKTWEELVADVEAVHATNPDIDGFVFQGAPYEGGTVDALEFLMGAGNPILSEDGDTAKLDEGDSAEHALSFVQSLVKDGVAPKVATTYQEEDARLAFQKGDAVFMRNWPYAWALMNQDEQSTIKGKFDIAPLPGFDGAGSASILGGQNLGLAATSKHPKLAWQAMQCMANEHWQRERAARKGEMPTLKNLYTDAALAKQVPFLDVLAAGLETGVNRPTTPYYNDVSTVIYKAYNDVLNGHLSPRDAVARMQGGVQAAIDGQAEI